MLFSTAHVAITQVSIQKLPRSVQILHDKENYTKNVTLITGTKKQRSIVDSMYTIRKISNKNLINEVLRYVDKPGYNLQST